MTWVVGQKVHMFSGGIYMQVGTVVKIMPYGLIVESSGERYRFNDFGMGCDNKGHWEGGPWELDDMPFAERVENMEKTRVQKGY
jgi:hypothetical protein